MKTALKEVTRERANVYAANHRTQCKATLITHSDIFIHIRLSISHSLNYQRQRINLFVVKLNDINGRMYMQLNNEILSELMMNAAKFNSELGNFLMHWRNNHNELPEIWPPRMRRNTSDNFEMNVTSGQYNCKFVMPVGAPVSDEMVRQMDEARRDALLIELSRQNN